MPEALCAALLVSVCVTLMESSWWAEANLKKKSNRRKCLSYSHTGSVCNCVRSQKDKKGGGQNETKTFISYYRKQWKCTLLPVQELTVNASVACMLPCLHRPTPSQQSCHLLNHCRMVSLHGGTGLQHTYTGLCYLKPEAGTSSRPAVSSYSA